MRPDKLYLVDIVDAVASIDRFFAGISRDDFDSIHTLGLRSFYGTIGGRTGWKRKDQTL